MAKFKERPKQLVELEAIFYDGELEPAKKMMGIDDAEYDNTSRKLLIPQEKRAFENKAYIEKGQYLVRVESETPVDGPQQFLFYPEDQEEFEKQYELIEE